MSGKKQNIFLRVWNFYFDGFKNMGGWGRQVWLIIIIKLIVMFAILKLFFFPDFLNTNFETDDERSNHVLEILTEPK